MPYAKNSDVNIYYEIHGEGEPHLFIQGAGANTKMLGQQMIEAFSAEHQLVIFDVRGAGQSDKPDLPYTMEMMADDVAGLMDTIGIQSAHIRGTSMGGMIALHFVLKYPERVRSLILTSTSCGGKMTSMFGTEMFNNFNMFLQEKVTVSEMMQVALQLSVSEGFLDKNPNFIKWMAPMSENPLPPHVWRHYIKAQFDHDVYDRLPEIKIPTLVLHGEEEKVIPVENARILASQIQDVELIIFENAGHMLIEAGNKPREIILDFLKRHREK